MMVGKPKFVAGALLSGIGISCVGSGLTSAGLFSKSVQLDTSTLKVAERDYDAVMQSVSQLSSASKNLTKEKQDEYIRIAKSLQDAADVVRSEYVRNSTLPDKAEVNKYINKFRDAMPPILAECNRRLKTKESDEQLIIADNQRRLQKSTEEVQERLSNFIAQHAVKGLNEEAAADIMNRAKELSRTLEGAPTLPEVEAAKVKLEALVKEYDEKLELQRKEDERLQSEQREKERKEDEERVRQFKKSNVASIDAALKRVKSLKKNGKYRAKAQEKFDELSALFDKITVSDDFSAFESTLAEFNSLLDDLNESEQRDVNKLKEAKKQRRELMNISDVNYISGELLKGTLDLSDVVIGGSQATDGMAKYYKRWMDFVTSKGERGAIGDPATLIYGPAGSGKTTRAIYVAASLGIETLKFSAAELLADPAAGTKKLMDTVKRLQTEGKNKNKFYQVLVDDVDGILNGDASNSSRKIITTALDYIADLSPKDVRVKIALTCNDIRGIAEEVKRSRRAGEIFFVGMLEHDEVKALFEKCLSYYDLADDVDIEYLADKLYGNPPVSVWDTVNGAAALAKEEEDFDPEARVSLNADQLEASLEKVLSKRGEARGA